MSNSYGITNDQIQSMVSSTSKAASVAVKTDVINKIIASCEALGKTKEQALEILSIIKVEADQGRW